VLGEPVKNELRIAAGAFTNLSDTASSEGAS
jgi:hypothetical protein